MVQSEQQVSTQVPQSQMSRRILRATGALMLIQVIIKGFGFIEKSILGHVVGLDFRTDAYNAARDIAFYLFQVVDQVVMHSFLPVFVQRMRERGERDAWRLASTTINLLIITMAVIALVGIIYTRQVLPFFVPDWFTGKGDQSPQLIPLTVTLTKMMLVAVIFLATSSMTYCLLNSYKKFALPASADLALKGTVLAFAIVFMAKWGPIALAAGFVCGAVAKVIVHSVGLRKKLPHYQPVLDVKHPGLRQFGLLALPLLLGVGFSIFRQVMDTRFTSSLEEGSLSALKFARTLTDMPVQFFPFVFGIALFPFLADLAAAGDKDRLRSMLMSATRMMVLIFVPLGLAIIALRGPLVFMAFGSKAMAAADPLQVYAVQMLVGALEIIVLQFFFAMSDTLRPTIIGMVMVPVHIGVAYAGLHYFGLGVMAIALALLVSKSLKVIVLYTMVRKKLTSLEGGRTLAFIGKVVLALVPFVAVLILAVHFLPEPTEVEGKVKKVLALLPYMVAGGAGTIGYLTVLHLLRVEELSLLLNKVLGKLRKGKQPASA